VIIVGDQKMTAAQVDKFLQALPPNYRAFYGSAGKYLLPQFLVRTKVLAAEAVKQKLDQQPDVVQALAVARETILADAARAYIERGITISDAELQDLYNKDKSLSQEVRISHILIRTAEAPGTATDPSHPALPELGARPKLEDIRKKILAGADFAQMAKQYSEDTTTAASGGDMGYIKRDQVVPPIVDAAYSLQPGQVSDLILTPFGLEIIKVVEKHVKTLAEAKPAVQAQLRQTKVNEATRKLAEQDHVFYDKQYFSGQPAKPASPASSASTPSNRQ
jgi:parvulin-like peptidyl-prolyl isomerase